MKLKSQGYSLLEMLVYIAILTMILGVSYQVFEKARVNNQILKQNAQDVMNVLDVGEQWREDIRTAIKDPYLAPTMALHIPRSEGEVIYQLLGETIIRKTTGENGQVILGKVKTSTMQPDIRSKIQGWRWEIELQSRSHAKIRPLFTFIAYSGKLK